MKKSTFEKKLASTKITGRNTVTEARAAQRVKRELTRYLQDAALAYLNEQEGREVIPSGSWMHPEYEFALNTRGSVTVKIISSDQIAGNKEIRRYTIPKKHLFK